ncbi:MAG: hypothetical protein PHU25_07310 [Deltaproteobacteria bacterium]|nr:hypothetical protein [Deltaproteobacteria bacterium]
MRSSLLFGLSAALLLWIAGCDMPPSKWDPQFPDNAGCTAIEQCTADEEDAGDGGPICNRNAAIGSAADRN